MLGVAQQRAEAVAISIVKGVGLFPQALHQRQRIDGVGVLPRPLRLGVAGQVHRVVQVRAGPPRHQRAHGVAEIDLLPHPQALGRPGVPEGVLPLAIEDDNTAVGTGNLGVDDLTSDRREYCCAGGGDNINAGVEVVAAVQAAPAEIAAQLGGDFVGQQGDFIVPRLLDEGTGQLAWALAWVKGYVFGQRFSAPLHLNLKRLAQGKIARCTVAPAKTAEVGQGRHPPADWVSVLQFDGGAGTHRHCKDDRCTCSAYSLQIHPLSYPLTQHLFCSNCIAGMSKHYGRQLSSGFRLGASGVSPAPRFRRTEPAPQGTAADPGAEGLQAQPAGLLQGQAWSAPDAATGRNQSRQKQPAA